MQPSDLGAATIAGVAALLEKRDVSPVDVVDACLARIAQLDPIVRSYITILGESARADARRAEKEIASGRYRGPLHGIPIAVKDIFQTAGVRTTCGSRLLAGWVPEEDATVIRRLADAGAILVGKLNMLEFAFRVIHPDYPPPRNPWDLTRSCAGSSSGSAAAVAASLCLGSLGTDTGGSIRIPAAYCGIVGMKPTYGLVSRTGVIPLAWTLDHVGPMAKTAEDAAILLDAIAGHDPADSTSARGPATSFRKTLVRDLRGMRLGVLRRLLQSDVAEDVRGAVAAAERVFGDLGMIVEDVELPRWDEAAAVQRTVIFSEAAAYHQGHLRDRGKDFSPRLREQLALGLALPAVQYLQAQRLRRLLIEEFQNVFARVDLLICPAAPGEAGPLEPETGAEGPSVAAVRPVSRMTGPFNVVGLPAVSVPCGYSGAGLPLAFQLAGRRFADDLVLAAAHAYQRATQWHTRLPTGLSHHH